MDGQSDKEIRCCFRGNRLKYDKSMELAVWTKDMGKERQALFAHKSSFSQVVYSSIPIHPDLLD